MKRLTTPIFMIIQSIMTMVSRSTMTLGTRQVSSYSLYIPFLLVKRNLQTYSFTAPTCASFKPFPFIFGFDSTTCSSNYEITGFNVDETTQYMLISAIINSPCSTFFATKKSILAMIDNNAIVKWVKFSQNDNSIPTTNNFQVTQPTFFRVDTSVSPDPPGTTYTTYVLAIATAANLAAQVQCYSSGPSSPP